MNLKQQSEICTLNYNKKIIASFKLAEQRTGFNLNTDFKSIIKDLNYRFPELKEEKLIEILKDGSLGKYGQIYKLSTMQICLWIKEEIKEDLNILNSISVYKKECDALKGYYEKEEVIYYFRLLEAIKELPSLMRKDAITFEQSKKIKREEKKKPFKLLDRLEIIAGSEEVRYSKALNIGIITWLNNN